MPNEKILAEKQQYVTELKESLRSICVSVIVSYKGIIVAEDIKLRRDLHETDDIYRVVKNTLLSRALKDTGIRGLNQILEGATAIAYSNDGYVSGVKILSVFTDKSKTFEIRADFVDGGAVNAAAVEELVELPSKEVLATKALGGPNTPIAGFATVLSGTTRGPVVALNAIIKKQAANA